MTTHGPSPSESTAQPQPQINAEAATQLYQGEQGRGYHEKKRALSPKALQWVTRLRAEKLQSNISATDVVFEYGVGAGWNLAALQCARRMGFDASEFLEENVRKLGIEFYSKASALPSRIADVVICHHTLEHLNVPTQTLAQIQTILKPGGKLLLYVPWDRERRYRTYNANDRDHHLYTWNAQSVGNLLQVNGYKVQKIATRRYGYDRFSGNFSARFGTGEAGFRLLRRMLLITIGLYEVEAVATPEAIP